MIIITKCSIYNAAITVNLNGNTDLSPLERSTSFLKVLIKILFLLVMCIMLSPPNTEILALIFKM